MAPGHSQRLRPPPPCVGLLRSGISLACRETEDLATHSWRLLVVVVDMQSIAAGLGGTNGEQLTSSSGCVQGLAAHNWSGYTVSSPALSPTATVTLQLRERLSKHQGMKTKGEPHGKAGVLPKRTSEHKVECCLWAEIVS